MYVSTIFNDQTLQKLLKTQSALQEYQPIKKAQFQLFLDLTHKNGILYAYIY